MQFIPRPGTPVTDIDTPSLVLELDHLEHNIEVMHSFFQNRPQKVRSVTKSHKSPDIANLQWTQDGAVPYGITCAKISEAEVMVAGGAKQVRMIEQVVGSPKIERLMSLAKRAEVLALVDHPENIKALSEAAQAFNVKLGILAEIEIGINRCGVQPGQEALDLVNIINKSKNLEFKGLSAHEGSLFIADFEQRSIVAKERVQKILDTRELLEQNDILVEICGAGSTSCWNIVGTMDGITEIDPGSYALYEAQYTRLIPDNGFIPALRVLTTVISKPTTDRLVTDVGFKSCSIDKGLPEVDWPSGLKVNRLNSEHGVIDIIGSEGKQLRLGDKIMLTPQYQGTTVVAHERYIGIRNNKVEAIFPILARGAHY